MSETPKRRRPVSAAPTYERQPLGRSPELQARTTEPEPLEREYRFEHARGARNGRAERMQQHQERQARHTLGWTCLFLLCFAVTAGIAWLVLPTLTGTVYHLLPTYAFVNGSVVTLDSRRLDGYRDDRAYMDTGRIYPGVEIDGVDVGGLTQEQAFSAVNAVSAGNGHDFLVTVEVEGSTWSMGSDEVPMTRNTDEIVAKAYAVGRQNTAGQQSGSATPFQERTGEARALKTHPLRLSTEMTYDYGAFQKLADTVAGAVNVEPVNAAVSGFDAVTKTFTFTDDQPGRYLDPEAIYQDILAQLDRGNYTPSLRYVPADVLASYTRNELASGFGLISTYSTKTTRDSDRNTNVRLSAEAVNGQYVMPGEEFSFNRRVGERTTAKGYRPAAAISGGQMQDEVGGGVCQTSSTLFNAVARANMTIVKRSPHAWPSSYIDPGYDATVNWPGLDFVFRNDTEWPIFLIAEYHDRKVTCQVYGMTLGPGISMDLVAQRIKTTKPSDEIKYVQNTALPPGTQKKTVQKRTGYEYVTYRITLQNGREVHREELFKSVYKAYQETIEYN